MYTCVHKYTHTHTVVGEENDNGIEILGREAREGLTDKMTSE